ncbi:unnamed protein product [Lota lota]
MHSVPVQAPGPQDQYGNVGSDQLRSVSSREQLDGPDPVRPSDVVRAEALSTTDGPDPVRPSDVVRAEALSTTDGPDPVRPSDVVRAEALLHLGGTFRPASRDWFWPGRYTQNQERQAEGQSFTSSQTERLKSPRSSRTGEGSP